MKNHPPEVQSLRTLLNHKARALRNQALAQDGQISADTLEAVGRLARLVVICEQGQAAPRRKRWPMLLTLTITLFAVSTLLFLRVPETDIELNITVSEVGFVLASRQALTDALNLKELGVSGLQEVRLPRAPDAAAPRLNGPDSTSLAIRISLREADEHMGSITLDPIMPTAGTAIRLQATALPKIHRLSLHGDPLLLRANVAGTSRLQVPMALDEELYAESPTAIILKSGNGWTDVDLSLVRPDEPIIGSLFIRDLSFGHVDQFADGDSTILRIMSTIRSGFLYLESLGGEQRSLRPGETLRFASSSGFLRALMIGQYGISLAFQGRVRGMVIGTGDSERSLMPTYLEWLRARHGLSLFWATTIYAIGLTAGALRWWGLQL